MSIKIQLAEKLNQAEMFRTCEQCGFCSSACPITGKNDFNIRRLLRYAELDLIDEMADSPFPWYCTACGRCEEVCPNGIKVLDITRMFRALSPPERIPDGPPCVLACPAGIDVPGYLRLAAQGKFNEAYELIMDKAPFPGILGRVCPHPCEAVCRRGEVNSPVAVCGIKRYIADHSEFSLTESPDPYPQSKKAAIIGAGPAGLTAAFYLRRKGHPVTVFEARPQPGGMMRYGIPSYRLPESVLDREIEQIFRAGIELRTGCALGKDFEVRDLKDQGFEAVFIAVGAQLSKKIALEGDDLEGVFWGLDFLVSISEGKDIPIKDRILVIGGGNVAIDVALTVLRLGAKQVTLACLESREEMPANPWEVQTALEEGVRMLCSWGPKKIYGENGKVSGAELVRCTSVFDDAGNFCPFFDDTVMTEEADQVILAVGQSGETEFCKDFCFPDDNTSLPVKNGLIAIDTETQETEMPGVFAGGDAANGPGTVIEAIAAGRRAAASIDRFLGGDGILPKLRGQTPMPEYTGKREKGFSDRRRAEMPAIPVSERHKSFTEVVELGFDEEHAKAEAKRCLECDLELNLAKIYNH